MSDVEGAPCVVAAVDGSEAGFAAVRFATQEAQRLGSDLELVHVVPCHDPLQTHIVTGDSLHRHGRSVLQQGEELARTLDGGAIAVRCTQLDGGRVPTIVDHAEGALLLALGGHHGAGVEHVWTGTTVTGVSAQAGCPVVVVPESWNGARAGRIVAAFKSPKHASELLASAFRLAEETHSELVVLHAWKLQDGYDDIISERVGRQRWELQMLAEIEPLLTEFRRAYPAVKVRIEVVHGQPAHVLIEASRAADRLLLVRPAHGSWAHHLGSTARAVLREAWCPVQVVPPEVGGTDTLGLELESHGELQR